jgi:hypothetical protein
MIWTWNDDQRSRVSQRVTSRQRLQNAQCVRSTQERHQRVAAAAYNLWRFWTFQPTHRTTNSQVNMIMQHYHASTNLDRKLDASLRYLQLQLGTPHNPFTLDYTKWGHLAPLSWVKMLWQLLHHFDIHLYYMAFPTIPLPWERDQVIIEIFQAESLSPEMISGLGRCRGVLEAIFLSDITTADG